MFYVLFLLSVLYCLFSYSFNLYDKCREIIVCLVQACALTFDACMAEGVSVCLCVCMIQLFLRPPDEFAQLFSYKRTVSPLCETHKNDNPFIQKPLFNSYYIRLT